MKSLAPLSLLPALALAACSTAPRPATTVQVPPPLIAPPPPAADWRDRPDSPGMWRYASAQGGSVATFGMAGAPSFAMRCDRARRLVILARTGASTGPLAVTTSYGTRLFPWNANDHGAPLAAADPALDQIAFSRGRFQVAAPGLPLLILPAWTEPSRIIEDCRS